MAGCEIASGIFKLCTAMTIPQCVKFLRPQNNWWQEPCQTRTCMCVLHSCNDQCKPTDYALETSSRARLETPIEIELRIRLAKSEKYDCNRDSVCTASAPELRVPNVRSQIRESTQRQSEGCVYCKYPKGIIWKQVFFMTMVEGCA
jgi:hypothetical protein